MKYSYVFSALVAAVSAHGVITEIQGANGVTMPGLSVADGTPRDCASPLCGSEADTSIIRAKEMGGKASALGRTKNGPVDAGKAIATFMGGNANNKRQLDQLLGGLGGGAGAAGKGNAAGAGAASAGQKTAKGTKEQGVSKAAGSGASSGMPTSADDGTITMTFHQVNQDGAGPLTAQIDATSGGTDPAAFKDAKVTQNVPGLGIGGLSAAQTTDFPVKVQMPAGMTCSGSAGGASNVCVVRLQNSALAGPFGGSAAFVQSAAAKKRAVEYNLRKLKTRSLLN
ncbi:hypothetical protein BT63DRAFT_454514 [Microthyrium microscopicum]|uniref:Cell surface protein n=1 Tax=Microthyrium microscopicum TaxID=703497 RepID=A0A6A6UFC0_9PEZI|nr:hypothetical protein BT63DRAFT_454514 [Microthyrium microscopicum]